MSTAKETRELAALGRGCLGKAADNEPVFVLRAQDMSAPGLVRLWAENASSVGCSSEKVAEALKCAVEMEAWPNRKDPD
jgi:hypothetical protein